MVICLELGADLHMAKLIPLLSSSGISLAICKEWWGAGVVVCLTLASVKSTLVYLSGTGSPA